MLCQLWIHLFCAFYDNVTLYRDCTLFVNHLEPHLNYPCWPFWPSSGSIEFSWPLLAFSTFEVLVDGFNFFFAFCISSILPLGESGIEHMIDHENLGVRVMGAAWVSISAKRIPGGLHGFLNFSKSMHATEIMNTDLKPAWNLWSNGVFGIFIAWNLLSLNWVQRSFSFSLPHPVETNFFSQKWHLPVVQHNQFWIVEESPVERNTCTRM